MVDKAGRTTFASNYRRISVGAIVVACALARGGAQVRPEIRPLQTITVTTRQFLQGDKKGKPSLLAAELRIPTTVGTGRLPAVILIHGSSGLAEYHERWAQEINSIGVAALLLDSFSGRGITNTEDDQSQLDTLSMMVDAYQALGALAQDSRIDANRIAVMGFSKGAVAAVYSSNERFRRVYAPNLQFAAHIGLYTPCTTTYRDDDKVTGKPIRLFHGVADDYVPIGPCRTYVERLKKKGVDVTLTEYPAAYHGYDNFLRKSDSEPVLLPQAVTVRNCQLVEGDNGLILNNKTGEPFNIGSDPCLERGAHLAYNEAATTATVKAVKEFLIAALRLKP